MARLYGPGPFEPPRLLQSGDLAGLSASDVDNRPVGSLFGTLAEERSGLIRYLDVEIQGAKRHVLVPIGHARIDRDAVPPRVRLRAATFEDLLAIPAYAPDETVLDAGYQSDLLRAHGRVYYGSRYYAHPSYDHRGPYAGENPVAGPGPRPDEPPRLSPLGELEDHRVARGEPDPRGWSLEGSIGRHVGEVRELLVELDARKVRYVVVDLDDPDRSVILPVGHLELNGEVGRARTPALTRDDIRLLPAYEAPLTREQENRLRAAIEGRLQGDRLFERPDFRSG